MGRTSILNGLLMIALSFSPLTFADREEHGSWENHQNFDDRGDHRGWQNHQNFDDRGNHRHWENHQNYHENDYRYEGDNRLHYQGKDEFHYKNQDYKYNKPQAYYNNNKIFIIDSDRALIRQHMIKEYRFRCPPGWMKRHNRCLPPGQMHKRYIIGRPLAVNWQPAPRYLLTQLQPVPYGYQYVMVDQDILLISKASRNVIDAITLLSAVNR